MAKLSSNGQEIGRIETLTGVLSYRTNGQILKNSGGGWKRFKHVKSGVDPVAHFHKRVEDMKKLLVENPAYATYRRLLHENFPVSKRTEADLVLGLLGDDYDGAWSEFEDRGFSVDLETVKALAEARADLLAKARADFKFGKIDI